MKAFDKWYNGRTSVGLDYQNAKILWRAARKGPKRKLRKLREQQHQGKYESVQPLIYITKIILQT